MRINPNTAPTWLTIPEALSMFDGFNQKRELLLSEAENLALQGEAAAAINARLLHALALRKILKEVGFEL